MNRQQLIHEIEVLPHDLQEQVFDFIHSLQNQQTATIKQRTVGEYIDKIHITEDFDQSLGDEFWLGLNNNEITD